jgi:hypothetical protein
MANPTAAELITFERSMFGRGKYSSSGDGQPVTNSARLKFDCAGFQKYCLRQTGIYSRYFDPNYDGTTVYGLFHAFKGLKDGGTSALGDLLIFGDPGSRYTSRVFAHIGMITKVAPKSAGIYISMYDTRLNIVEMHVNETPIMRPTHVMHLGLI